MAKPFKLSGTSPANVPPNPAGIGRQPDGKFVKLEAPEPSGIIEEAKEANVYVSQAVQERRVPDRLVGDPPAKQPPPLDPARAAKPPVYKDAIPWPDASGPNNETGTKPMKLTGGD